MISEMDIGTAVTDGQRTGTLADILQWRDPARPTNRQTVRMAYVRPFGGGCEWTAEPMELAPYTAP